MAKQTISIAVSAGSEERPIAKLVQLAGEFVSSIYLETENKRINAKSIMGMMTMGLCSGKEITVTAEGDDEEKAVKCIVEFLTRKGE